MPSGDTELIAPYFFFVNSTRARKEKEMKLLVIPLKILWFLVKIPFKILVFLSKCFEPHSWRG